MQKRVTELLELVGLTSARHRRLSGYSKGMLQRIGLAQALIHEPKLVVLDEPTAGVDPAGSREICDLILDLKQRGVTVLLSSHLLGQVQEICDRVGILAQGRLVREGPLRDMIAIENQTELILENASPELLAANRGCDREVFRAPCRTTPAADDTRAALSRDDQRSLGGPVLIPNKSGNVPRMNGHAVLLVPPC